MFYFYIIDKTLMDKINLDQPKNYVNQLLATLGY